MSQIVFYLNPGATADVLGMIREELPAGWTLLPAEGSDYSRQLADCDFILVPDQPVREEHLAAAPRLKMIQHQGVGYERIDLAACRKRKLPLCLTPEGTTIGVAEHTILLILGLYKQLVKAAVGATNGKWMQWELRGGSFELAGKTLGLLGLGRIGREVAKRALAFDARVINFDPLVSAPGDLLVMRCNTQSELLADFLRQCKSTAILVNTARGALVDEPALVESLKNGQLGGAALDVLAKEPPDASNPLLHMPNVLVTPHIAAGTRDALKTKMRAAFANMQRRARGEKLMHLVPELADLFEGTP